MSHAVIRFRDRSLLRSVNATRVLLAFAGIAVPAVAALPPATLTCQFRSGTTVIGMGAINTPFMPSSGGAVGTNSFGALAINNLGYGMAAANIYAAPPLDSCLLATDLGRTPFIGAGFLPGDGPSLGLPTADYAARSFLSVDLNNAGVPALGVQVGQGDFGPSVPSFHGITQGTAAFVVRDGQVVTAAGVAPGSTFNTLNAARVLGLNDQNDFLVGAPITESGITRNALFRIRTDASGSVLSQTLVAKEGGLVRTGPSTWTRISIAPGSAAINNAGSVVFSGTTSSGEQAVYVDSVPVARTNDPSAIPGQLWGNLFGVPVDLNASGSVAIRGPWGDGIVDEASDAGEDYTLAQLSTEGSLNLIRGSLSNDQDVDLYRIRIADYANFSATTVPSAGFPGSSGDTVLYLLRDFYNGNGITRTVLARSDDAAVGVPQSSLTAANLPPDTGNGTGDYYLAVATPKSRPVTSAQKEFFQEDPASIAIAGGKVYWTDPSEGTIVRANIATGVIEASYAASSIPAPYSGQVVGTGKLLNQPLAIVDSGASRYAYWTTSAFADLRQSRADLNASTFSIQDIRTSTGQPGEYAGMTGIAYDSTSGRLYWSRGDAGATDIRGVINYSNLDGTGGGTLLASTAIGPRPRHLAVHTSLRRIYFTETAARRIARVNIDGATPVVTAVATNVTPTGIAIDQAAGKVYWSVASTGLIERCNVDGTSRETFKSGLNVNGFAYFPGSIAIDGSFLYFADLTTRQVIRMSTASLQPATQLVVQLPARVGDRTSDSPSHLDAVASWARTGAPSSGSIAYQVKLTGAQPYNEQAAVAVDGVKIATTGDVPAAGTGGAPLATVGGATSPVRLSDSGLVAYRGTWGTGSSAVTGLFLGADLVADSNTAVTGSAGGVFRHVVNGPDGFDMSDSGQYIIASTGPTSVAFGSTPEYQVNIVAFDSVPAPDRGCIGDYNQDGGVDGSDVEAFFLDWETGTSAADLNQDGGVDGSDIEAFFIAWQSGC